MHSVCAGFRLSMATLSLPLEECNMSLQLQHSKERLGHVANSNGANLHKTFTLLTIHQASNLP